MLCALVLGCGPYVRQRHSTPSWYPSSCAFVGTHPTTLAIRWHSKWTRLGCRICAQILRVISASGFPRTSLYGCARTLLKLGSVALVVMDRRRMHRQLVGSRRSGGFPNPWPRSQL
jgi:hypothetical protein